MAGGSKNSSVPDKFQTVNAIVAWATSQGYQVKKSTIYNSAKEAGFPLKGKDGAYDRAQVEKYAKETWPNPKKAEEHREKKGIPMPEIGNPKLRLQIAQAEEKEFKYAILKGKYYLKSAEDQRSAQMLYGIKTAVENWAPFIIQDMISLAGIELGTDAAAALGRITPELRARYLNSVAEKFDEISQKGAIEVPNGS